MIRFLLRSAVLIVLLASLPVTVVLSQGQDTPAMPEAMAASPCRERAPLTTGQGLPESSELRQYTAGGHVLAFRENGVIIASGSHALKVEFVNANPVAPIQERTPSEPAAGHKGAPALGKIAYRGLWEGVTIVYEESETGLIKSTYRLRPVEAGGSGSVDRIRLRYNVPIRVDESGNLVMSFATGEMRETRPVAWQEVSGGRVDVEAEYRLLGGREVGFKVGAYDPRYPLVIDPALTWNTFMGGLTAGGWQYGLGISVDTSGNSYVVGWSDATWGSPRLPFAGESDAFVAKLDANGALLWNTFLGSIVEDWGYGIAVDTSGNSYVVGWARGTFGSPIRPFTSPGTLWEDAFVAKLDTDGYLQWNTFLGGGRNDRASGIGLDTSGNIYVAGTTSEGDAASASWGPPIENLPFVGWENAFVAKLGADGVLIWNGFIGGSTNPTYGGSYANDIAVDTSVIANLYVTGTSLATWGLPIHDHTGSWTDVMVAKLDTNGTLKWNTFLGGGDQEGGYGIAVDTNGNAYVTGTSEGGWVSTLLPFTPSSSDAFVAKFDANGALQWDTFLGGGHLDEGQGIALDTSGNPHVIGRSGATWGVPVERFHGYGEIFVAKLNVDGGLQWNTFLGSYSASDFGHAIALDASRSCYVTGYSMATWGTPISPYPGGYTNPFVAKISNFVTSPSGGEIWEVGSLHDITWTGFSGPVLIEYSVDNGLNWEWIGYEADNDGVYPWTVANDPSSQCRIRIADAEDYDPTDTSEGAFTITGFAVSSPNGGEQWIVGTPHTITWNTVGDYEYVKIWFSTDNGSTWETIAGATVNDGSYEWIAPVTISSKYLVKVGGVAEGDPADTSDAVFSVLPVDGFLVVAPNGGERWYNGFWEEIRWQTSGNYLTVRIQYSVDNGDTWKLIADTDNVGSYYWAVPGELSSQCLVQVSDTDGTPFDISDAAFFIGPEPTITVTSPAGGEVWRIGSTHDITWTYVGLAGTVTIALDNDETWVLGTADVSDGVFSWTISPDIPPGNEYEIVISQGDDEWGTEDEFTIVGPAKVDFNKDGQEDLLWRCYGTEVMYGVPGQGWNVVWFMGQSGTLSPMTLNGVQSMAGDRNLLTLPAPRETYLTPMEVGRSQTAGPERTLISPMDVGGSQMAGLARTFASPMDVGKPKVARPIRTVVSPRDAGNGKDARQEKLTKSEDDSGRILSQVDSLHTTTENIAGDAVLQDMGGLAAGDAKLMAIDYGSDALLYTVADLSWEIAGAGDFDGDGSTDVLWRYYGAGQGQGTTIIWFMDGTAISYQDYPYRVSDTDWRIDRTGDLNGDGRADILWRYYGTGPGQGTTIIWYMNGAEILGQASPYRVTDTDWKIDGIGDFDGDGRADLLWRYYGTGGAQGTTIIWYMDGTTILSQGYPYRVTDTDWKIDAIGDFDADWKTDLVWRYYGTGQGQGTTIIWYMNGAEIKGQDGLYRVTYLDWRIVNR